MAPICLTLGTSRACACREGVERPVRYVRADDRSVTAQSRTVTRTRTSYGARRVRALVNRECETACNLKRIQRVTELNGWQLPRPTRRRTRRVRTGRVQLGFALDCHDREAPATVAVPRDPCAVDIQALMHRAVAARFGEHERSDAPIR
jgi:hypothetical protein